MGLDQNYIKKINKRATFTKMPPARIAGDSYFIVIELLKYK